jgi:hypothetical protein
MKAVMIDAETAKVDAEVQKRLRLRADDFLHDLQHTVADNVPAAANAAEKLMFAHLLTATDGYNHLEYCDKWSRLPKNSMYSFFAYLPDVGGDTCPTFAVRCRLNEDYRDLAIIIDNRSPGERLPVKMMLEQDLKAREFKIVLFSEHEVLASPDRCREQVEQILERLNDEMIKDVNL